MKDYTKTQLIDLELQQIRKLSRIASYFTRREKKDTVKIMMNTVADFLLAQNDNSESFNEVFSGISLEPVELHLKACEEAGVEFCICNVLLGKNGTTETQEVL